MTSAGFGPPEGPTPLSEPWGHAIIDDGFGPTPAGPDADNPPAMGPAGTVHASLADLVAYYQVHLAGAMGGGPLLSQSSFAVLHAPAAGTDYACGWAVVNRTWAGGAALSHEGSNNFWFGGRLARAVEGVRGPGRHQRCGASLESGGQRSGGHAHRPVHERATEMNAPRAAVASVLVACTTGLCL